MIAIERRRVLVKASTVVGTLEIMGVTNISAVTCQFVALLDSTSDVSSSCTWSIVSGSEYATMSGGTVTILQGAHDSIVRIRAVYGTLSAEQDITLTYDSDSESETM